MSITLDELLSPLASWLDDSAAEEICVNGPGTAWVWRDGQFERHAVPLDAQHIEDIAIVAAAQRRQDVDADRPLLATDLAGRGRLQAVLPPCVAVGFPSLTIRRGSTAWPSLDGLAAAGLFYRARPRVEAESGTDVVLTELYRAEEWPAFFRLAVQARKTIVACGRNASGKTHLAKALIAEIPEDERLITVEDSPELIDLRHPNRVQLYYAKDAPEGAPGASDLVEAALRMRIGRLFLQEIRDGAAAIAFLSALQSGHPGGITTIHASNCGAVFDRLRVLIKQTPAGAAVSDSDLVSQFGQLIDVIVHTERAGQRFAVDEVWFGPQASP